MNFSRVCDRRQHKFKKFSQVQFFELIFLLHKKYLSESLSGRLGTRAEALWYSRKRRLLKAVSVPYRPPRDVSKYFSRNFPKKGKILISFNNFISINGQIEKKWSPSNRNISPNGCEFRALGQLVHSWSIKQTNQPNLVYIFWLE